MATSDDHQLGPKLISMGCRLNGYESEAMRRLAHAAGVDDAVVINSCAVTNEAVRQTRQNIRRAARDNPTARVVVTGCAAQIDPSTFAAMPEVTAVLGNSEKLDPEEWRALSLSAPDGGSRDQSVQEQGAQKRGAPDQSKNVRANIGASVRVNDIMSVRETAGHLIDGYGDRARAFVQVQNGCDHRCTFCIIPYGRGNARSTPIEQVVAQASRLVENGHREIVLTGVDITSWGADLPGAPKLGRLVSAILEGVPSLFRLRLSSIDGAEIDDELFDRIVSEQRIAPHVHLSLQAGDNMILKRMKRRHTREQAIDLCNALRTRRPEIAFGADIIAGFPTETEDMFARSLAIVDEAALDYLHVFPFSPRTGTPAERMPQLERQVIKDRARRLREKAAVAKAAFLDRQVGLVDDAIVESGGRARLANFAEVNLDGANMNPLPVGSVIRLRLISHDGSTLTALHENKNAA
ncbi:MAG: tRNA (N(6)-L-threonylcarbamoyladenosine(37)-C(2))-methylthiotransferase MtaB [Pseudomonadota bacterium]